MTIDMRVRPVPDDLFTVDGSRSVIPESRAKVSPGHPLRVARRSAVRRSDLDGDRLQRSAGGRVRLQHAKSALTECMPLDLIRGTRGVAVLHRRAVVEAGDAAAN